MRSDNLSMLEGACLKVMRRFPGRMPTRSIRIAINVRQKGSFENNKSVLDSLKRLRSKGYVVSERIDHQLFWELSK